MMYNKKFVIVITIIISLLLLLLFASLVLLAKNLTQEGTITGFFLRTMNRHYQPETLTVPPPHVLPVPNGYETFAQAGKLLVDELRIKTLFTTVKSAKPPDQARYISQMRQIVGANTRAMSRWRQGLAQSYLVPSLRDMDMADQARAQRKTWHTLAKLALLQARCQAADGNWSGAADSALDVIQFGITVPRGGELLDGVFGTVIQGEGRDALLPSVPHLTPPQARAVLHRLAAMASGQVSCADLYQDEMTNIYCLMKTGLLEQEQKKEPITPAFRHNVDVALEPYLHYMQRCRANARLPFAEQQPVSRPHMDFIIAAVAPNITGLEWKCTEQKAKLDLLQLELALHMYHLEHGRYPAALPALAPAYLPAIPADPFTRRPGSYRYRLRGQDYVLYSVGGNCRDDGGTNPPATDKVKHGDILDGHVRQ